jgi:hypothetical protein
MKYSLALLVLCMGISAMGCGRTDDQITSANAASPTPSRQPTKKHYVADLAQNCEAKITVKQNGDVDKVQITPGACTDVPNPDMNKLIRVGGWDIVDSNGTIILDKPSIGALAGGKMICYGPPAPSPPRCVCLSGTC